MIQVSSVACDRIVSSDLIDLRRRLDNLDNSVGLLSPNAFEDPPAHRLDCTRHNLASLSSVLRMKGYLQLSFAQLGKRDPETLRLCLKEIEAAEAFERAVKMARLPPR
jgi:hypothetical protein